tara:strand:- start:46 stop:480 length:435 start_codon:yes stop_codon:yes gene_type:complete
MLSMAQTKTVWGLGASYGSLSVDDPKGNTGSDSLFYISGFLSRAVNRNHPSWRYFFELNYRSFELAPSATEIGQDVSSFALSGTLQKGFDVSDALFQVWLGAGASIELNEFENRQKTNASGKLATKYANRSETNYGLLLNTGAS